MHTRIKIDTRTPKVLMMIRLFAWVSFIGLTIQAGAVLTSYCISCVHPAAAKNLYNWLDLSVIKEYSFLHYSLVVLFTVLSVALKAYVVLLLIKAVSRLSLAHPFQQRIVNILTKMSYVFPVLFVTGLVHNVHAKWLSAQITTPYSEWAAGEYLFVACLVFIVGQVYKSGVSLQSENDLTV